MVGSWMMSFSEAMALDGNLSVILTEDWRYSWPWNIPGRGPGVKGEAGLSQALRCSRQQRRLKLLSQSMDINNKKKVSACLVYLFVFMILCFYDTLVKVLIQLIYSSKGKKK